VKPPAALLVTGTDTGVGKTVVGSALLAAWREAGCTTGAYKPVESGVEGRDPADGRMLWEAAGKAQTLVEVCPTRLRAPLAPPVAARQEGVTLEPAPWVATVARMRSRFDLLLVEGAGGLLSPLWEGGDAAALALRCGLPALVVAPDRLGVINHTRLVAEVLAQRGITLAAVVLSRVDGGDPSCDTNRDEIARWVDAPVVGPLPFVHDLSPAALAAVLRGAPGAEALLPDDASGQSAMGKSSR